MKNKLRTLGLAGLLTLTGCGNDQLMHLNKDNRNATWYVIQEKSNNATYLFDREGDGKIDEILKTDQPCRLGLATLWGLEKDKVEYFVREGIKPKDATIQGPRIQTLTAAEAERASEAIKTLYKE